MPCKHSALCGSRRDYLGLRDPYDVTSNQTAICEALTIPAPECQTEIYSEEPAEQN